MCTLENVSKVSEFVRHFFRYKKRLKINSHHAKNNKIGAKYSIKNLNFDAKN